MSECFVIAEVGVNHNGSIELATELIRHSAEAGADCVKFQTFTADELVCPGTASATYQAKTTGQTDQHALLKGLELSDAAHLALRDACHAHGVEFLSTGFSVRALRALLDMGVQRIKIPSGEITNPQILDFAGASGLPVILSTGMANMDEIEAALARLNDAGQAPAEVTVLHCTSAYPAPVDQLNLRAISSIAERFGVPVGYSDHSAGVNTGALAVALGAVCVEKHVTMDRTLPGPDHAASLEPAEFAQYVAQIRDAQKSLGDGHKAPVAAELEARSLVRRSVAMRCDRAAGHVLKREDLILRRPGTGLDPMSVDTLAGRTLARDVVGGALLGREDLVE